MFAFQGFARRLNYVAMSDFRREKVCNKVVEGEIKEQEH